jgi:hypothetical protein
MRSAPGLLGAALVFLTATDAWPACGDVPEDAAQLAAARAQVATDCDCAGAASHGAFVTCAGGIASARVTGGLLRLECTREVRRCAMRSTCGRPGAVTCCRTRNGVTRCRVKRSAAACTAPLGGSACVGAFASCCDACSASGCIPTTTSSTTTSTTSTSTMTTIPRIPCTGGTGVPECTGGACDPGFECATFFSAPGGPDCACMPAGTAVCGSGPYPQCGGVCPGATVCGALQFYDAPTGTILRLCACMDPAQSCTSGPDGLCAGVGPCGPGLVCYYALNAPPLTCPCCGCGPP